MDHSPRALYAPAHAVKISDKKSDAVAYIWTVTGSLGSVKYLARIYYGKQKNAVAFYSYRSAERREEAVRDYFEARQAKAAEKKSRAEERKNFVHSYKVGDIFRASWGYEQTNVDWYEVTSVKGKKIGLRKIAATLFDTSLMTGKSAPLPGQYVGEEFYRLPRNGSVKIEDYCRAYYEEPKLVAGVPVYKAANFSSYA